MPDTSSLILSISAFAARRGVSVSAVCKWIERGRISGAALTDDKPRRIVVAEAERQLGVTLDVVRSESAMQHAAARAAAEPTPPADLGTREQILRVDLEQRRRKLAADRGVYVRADLVRAERGRALATMVAAIDNWLPDLAGELALDRDGLATLRTSWRRFRERQADALDAEAEQLPELLTDAA